VDLVVGQPRPAPDDGRVEGGSPRRPPAGSEFRPSSQDGFTPGFRLHTPSESSGGQHRNATIGEVDAGAAEVRLPVKRRSRLDVMGDIGDRNKKAETSPLTDEANSVVEVPGILPVDRDERKFPQVDPGERLVPWHTPAAAAERRTTAGRPPPPRARDPGMRRADPSRRSRKEKGLHRVRLPEGADQAGPPLLSPFGVFGNLREDKLPGFRRKIRRKVHLEEEVGLPVAESNEGAVPRRRVPPDKHTDTPFQDPFDPPYDGPPARRRSSRTSTRSFGHAPERECPGSARWASPGRPE